MHMLVRYVMVQVTAMAIMGMESATMERKSLSLQERTALLWRIRIKKGKMNTL